MIVVYQYLLSLGEMYVSSASRNFVKIYGPGILGGSLFHLLPTIPQLLLVLASGLSASTETAEQQAAMGMGLLAGTAVMMLTLVWGSCVAFGSYDLSGSEESISSKSTPFSLTGYGLITDKKTRWTAVLMLASMIPLIILQLSKIINSPSATRIIILVALIVTLILLIANCIFLIFKPWVLTRRYEYLSQKYMNSKLLTLFTYRGVPNEIAIRMIFDHNDKDGDKKLSRAELRALIRGMKLKEDGIMGIDDYVENVMIVFDSIPDDNITEEEFTKAVVKWIKDARFSETNSHQLNSRKDSGNTTQDSQSVKQSLLDKTKKIRSSKSLLVDYSKATFELLLGVAILATLSMPYIKTVGSFSEALNIPQFFVPYVVIPFAMNYRRALLFITAAQEKTRSSISLTLSEIYGSVFMNIMIGLTTFLSLVYSRNLSWNVDAEVLVVLLICTTMGVLSAYCKKFQVWTSILAIALYPISLLMLYFFTIIF
jgi:Ca2+/Na+ antiporter